MVREQVDESGNVIVRFTVSEALSFDFTKE